MLKGFPHFCYGYVTFIDADFIQHFFNDFCLNYLNNFIDHTFVIKHKCCNNLKF